MRSGGFCGQVALLAEGVDRNVVAGFSLEGVAVALLAEGVDRNLGGVICRQVTPVALLAEGVDRNCIYRLVLVPAMGVALLAEGVDRNSDLYTNTTVTLASPSSRRAWIEIRSACRISSFRLHVALLAEGVDRNNYEGKLRDFLECRPPRGGRG